MPIIDDFLRRMLELDGSDLHLMNGMPPRIRATGRMQTLDEFPVMNQALTEQTMREVCSEERWEHYLKNNDLDIAYEIEGLARFRVNFLRNHLGMAAVLRQIPAKILTLEKLNLPKAIRDICYYESGLVFVTGPTGSGKSTTLAAMIDFINKNFAKHIITVEDPVEFVHQNHKSIIVHREVGEHARSFGRALESGMRADPDIILVGEMRELETIRLALGCASMGMLVFGTLHTNNAPKTIDRVIDAFPAPEQAQIRTMLAGCLSAVVSQLLCRTADGKGRCAVHEILLQNEGLPNTIREGAISNIRTIIEGNQAQGMCTMDGTLRKRYEEGIISSTEAYMKANDKVMFRDCAPDENML
ncbi:MAG: twitching motility protein PilT [Rhodothermales bacterium]|jgi:twitching motility protein PilT